MSLDLAEKKINYKFANRDYLSLALKAAHRSELDGIEDDGNRGLSQIGVYVIEFVEAYRTVLTEKGTQKLANSRKSWIKSKNDRAKVCRDLGIHEHVVCSTRQQEPSSTVLANALSAIFGAVWMDLEEQKKTGGYIVKRMSSILQYVDAVASGEATLGQFTNEDGGSPAISETEGSSKSLSPNQWSPRIQNEPIPDMSSFIDLEVSFSQSVNETLLGNHPISSYFGDDTTMFDFPDLEHAQDPMISSQFFPSSVEVGTVVGDSISGSGSLASLELVNLRTLETATAPMSLIENGTTLVDHASSSRARKSPMKAVTPHKRKFSQDPKTGITDNKLIERLVHEEMEKMHTLKNQCNSEQLMTLLDNSMITNLGHDMDWIPQLRLFYFTIGSCQSILHFKEILENARKTPSLPTPTFGHCRTTADRYQTICRLNRIESLCTLLRRCYIVELFEMEPADITQSSLATNVETPSTFSTGRRLEAGNPQNKQKAIITDTIMEKIVPELEKGSKEYERHRRRIAKLRRLAKPLHLLTERFGFGILALIPSGPESELNVSDDILTSIPEMLFRHFLKIVDDYQGLSLRELSSIVEPVLERLVQGELESQNLFQIECVEAGHLARFPKGSPEILACLTDSPRST